MATNWPSSVQTFTNPTSGSSLSSPSHADQHATVNDTVEALQNYAGLVLVKSVTIGSGVSSVTVTDAFDSRFDNYQVVMTGVDSSVLSDVYVTVGSKTTGYYGSGIRTYYTSTTITVVNRNNGTAWFAGQFPTNAAGQQTLTFGNPYNSLKPVTFQAQGVAGGYTLFFMGDGGSATTSYSDFTITPGTGTITGGTIRVYGYNNGV